MKNQTERPQKKREHGRHPTHFVPLQQGRPQSSSSQYCLLQTSMEPSRGSRFHPPFFFSSTFLLWL